MCVKYYANVPGKFCGEQDMRAWQVCGTLGAHKSPQSMYYIGGSCERFAHSPPGARIQTRKANSRWESRKYDSPPTTRSELLFPFHPFSGVGGRRAVGSAAIAKLLCSYSGSPVGESNKLLVATFTAALPSYEESR